MSKRDLKLPHGVSVTVEQPFVEGHVLSAVEAEKLNQVLADSIRTSIMAKLKRLAKDGAIDADAASEEFQAYADSYGFAVRTRKASQDPVTKEAHKIAKNHVLSAIRNKGGNLSDYSADQISEYVGKVLAAKPEILAEAKRRVESSRKMADDLLSEIFNEAA